MEIILVVSVLIIGSGFAYEGDVASLCPGTIPLKRVPATGEGTWWVYLSNRLNQGSCGITNNESPCSCTGIKVTSNIMSPYVPNYNTTSFGYDSENGYYVKSNGSLNLIDPNQEWTVFNLTDYSSNSSMVVSSLDTDNHEYFVIFYICGVTDAAGKPIAIVLLKSPKWTMASLPLETQERIYQVLNENNISPDDLQSFKNANCPTLDI